MSVNSEDSDQMEDYDSDDEYQDYYNNEMDDLEVEKSPYNVDPEYFKYTLLRIEDVERLLNENVEVLCQSLEISPSLAKLLLHVNKWATDEVKEKYSRDSEKCLVQANILPKNKPKPNTLTKADACLVCYNQYDELSMSSLSCGHQFCRECWEMHFNISIKSGVATGIECMANECNVLAPEDFVLNLLTQPQYRDKYQQFMFRDHVESHPLLRFCPGPNCSIVIYADVRKSKRVVCTECKTMSCFNCGLDYHSPTDCEVIKKWLTKCADDSETANYISAHTKDCPKCHVCIEKNGGCNHMQCCKCKYDFCWMCLGDWKAHGSEYYECSRYKENPNIVNESVHAKAREALKKYLFYFERYENHAKSLKLEEHTLNKIKERINEKVMNNTGTWIDWQYLFDAASLLRKCRYTLQYTYPYAYYMEKSSRKELFEYQQAQLEAEVENLSWKVERAEITDRGDLENQMHIAETKRLTLVQDFLEV